MTKSEVRKSIEQAIEEIKDWVQYGLNHEVVLESTALGERALKALDKGKLEEMILLVWDAACCLGNHTDVWPLWRRAATTTRKYFKQEHPAWEALSPHEQQ